jgi:hypothetical protein
MKNIYKEISKGVVKVSKNMHGCIWDGVSGDFLVSSDISYFVWQKLEISESHYDYIHMVATVRLVDAFYNK